MRLPSLTTKGYAFMASSNNTTKRCSHCGNILPITEFSPKGNSYSSWCKACRRIAYPARKPKTTRSLTHHTCTKCKRTLPATAEYFHRSSYAKTGWNAHCKDCRRKHYYDHHETIRAKNNIAVKDWTRRNREHIAKRTRIWGMNNRDKTRAMFQRRRARLLNLPCEFTGDDWLRALSYFKNRCAVCNRPQGLWHTLAQDHWIPIIDPNCPGTVPTNIVPLCHGIDGCNNSKSSSDARQWLITRYGKRKANHILRKIEEFFRWVEASTE